MCVWLEGQCYPEPREVMWELWLVGFREEKPRARFQATEILADSGRLGRQAGCWLVLFLTEALKQLLRWRGFRLIWCFPLLWFCSMFIVCIKPAAHTQVWECWNPRWWSDDTATPLSILLSLPGETSISCEWEPGSLFGRDSIFFVFPRVRLSIWTFTCQNHLEWGLLSLWFLRIAEWRYHLSQGDHNRGFPVWTPTLNSLETEVLGIVYFIYLAQTLTGLYFPKNLFEKDSCLIPLEQHV